jgi:hypothetical protein
VEGRGAAFSMPGKIMAPAAASTTGYSVTVRLPISSEAVQAESVVRHFLKAALAQSVVRHFLN